MKYVIVAFIILILTSCVPTQNATSAFSLQSTDKIGNYLGRVNNASDNRVDLHNVVNEDVICYITVTYQGTSIDCIPCKNANKNCERYRKQINVER